MKKIYQYVFLLSLAISMLLIPNMAMVSLILLAIDHAAMSLHFALLKTEGREKYSILTNSYFNKTPVTIYLMIAFAGGGISLIEHEFVVAILLFGGMVQRFIANEIVGKDEEMESEYTTADNESRLFGADYLSIDLHGDKIMTWLKENQEFVSPLSTPHEEYTPGKYGIVSIALIDNIKIDTAVFRSEEEKTNFLSTIIEEMESGKDIKLSFFKVDTEKLIEVCPQFIEYCPTLLN